MKLLIDHIEILNAYSEIRRNPPRNERRPEDLYPDIIKEILATDKTLMPKHIEHGLFKRLFIGECLKIEPRFKIDQANKPIINTLCLYLRKEPEFLTITPGNSFEKGILLRGKVGSGKTVIIKAMGNLMSIFRDVNPYSGRNFDMSFRLIESWVITRGFTKGGFELLSSESFASKHGDLTSSLLCIDDMGSEQSPAYYYQNGVNIIAEILMDRYSYMKDPSYMKDARFRSSYNYSYFTHGTSNLDIKSLKAFYGDRVFSRMKEMFNDIILTGEDRRQ